MTGTLPRVARPRGTLTDEQLRRLTKAGKKRDDATAAYRAEVVAVLLEGGSFNEVTRYASFGYVKFEPYPGDDIRLGRYWKQDQLDAIGKGCGTVTTMGAAIAETYAREPGFYGGTYCCGCSTHKPVGPDGEFVWEGTNQRVGT